jgi:hypothetical protein
MAIYPPLAVLLDNQRFALIGGCHDASLFMPS